MNNTEKKTLTPQMFGAVADGVTDDYKALAAAIEAASREGKTLELPEGNYRTEHYLVLDHINVQSHNATISCYDLTLNMPAIDMRNNVNIYGTLTVYHVNSVKWTHGGRAGMGFGNYETGVGAHNCYVEHVIFLGGSFLGANAVFVTGDSSDLTFGKITVPEGTEYGRAFLSHWGGTKSHNAVAPGNASAGIWHAENADYTKHPHGVKIGTIEHLGATEVPELASALALSASYDFTVDELICKNTTTAVEILGGDAAFEWAAPEVKAIGMRGLYVKKITATGMTRRVITLCPYTGYLNFLSVKCQLTIDEADISVSPNCKESAVMAYCMDNVKIGKLTVRDWNGSDDVAAVRLTAATQNTYIDELNFENCTGALLRMQTSLKRTEPTKNVQIASMTVKGCKNPESAAIICTNVEDARIASLSVDGSSEYKYLLSATPASKNICVEALNTENKELATAVLLADGVTDANKICIGKSI